MLLHRFLLTAAALTGLSFSAPAQWLNLKTPGIPRTADGKPSLSAPTPKLANGKPDVSGVWLQDPNAGAGFGKAMDSIKPKPWADEVAKKRKEDLYKDSPGVLCLPSGPMGDPGNVRILHTPALLVMLYSDTLYRQIFLDGRSLEKDPNPDWMGYSVGHWDGDTLVVESNGYNDRTWLDSLGHPHTEALRLTEHIRRPDFGHLEVTKTFTDLGALEEPWTVPLKFVYDADNEPIEYICNENEKDHQHLTGKASDLKGVSVPREVLSQYTGGYDFNPPDRPDTTISFEFAVENDQLVMKGLGPKVILIPLSTTQFSTDDGTLLDFARDSDGKVTHVTARIVEGDFKATKKK